MTNLTELYDIFLSKISDYSFLTIPESELEDELLGYLKSSKTKFYKCKSSLNIVDQAGVKSFESELHPFELEILATLMLVEYLKPKVLSSEVLKQSLSDKDFKIYSQSNQLRELNLLYRMFRTEASKMIVEYTYFDLNNGDFK